MPYSGNDFVKETKKYIKENYPDHSYILDIGAGAGKFGKELKGYKIDAIEIWKPYIIEFCLSSIYNDVFNINALDFSDFSNYDLILMWKTLEHLTPGESRALIDNIKDSQTDFIFSVPFMCKQGVCYGNKYEIHKQDDLTPEVIRHRYPDFKVLFESQHHGVYKYEA